MLLSSLAGGLQWSGPKARTARRGRGRVVILAASLFRPADQHCPCRRRHALQHIGMPITDIGNFVSDLAKTFDYSNGSQIFKSSSLWYCDCEISVTRWRKCMGTKHEAECDKGRSWCVCLAKGCSNRAAASQGRSELIVFVSPLVN